MKSPLQSRSGVPNRSTENTEQDFGVISQMPLAFDRNGVLPGSLNDSHMIRAILVDAIRRCGKSREVIAEEMTYLVGREITERQLNGFTAESKEDYKFPAELDRAFCMVVGDTRLLTCRVERAGMHVITDDEKLLLELGRQHLRRNQAAEQIQIIERQLNGRLA
jgi:serine/threonine protein phosphatase PrpC